MFPVPSVIADWSRSNPLRGRNIHRKLALLTQWK